MGGSQQYNAHGRGQARVDTSCTVLLKEPFTHLVITNSDLRIIENASASVETESRLLTVWGEGQGAGGSDPTGNCKGKLGEWYSHYFDRFGGFK